MSALFSKMNIGGLEIKNRVIMAPMLMNFASFKGEVTPFLIKHYAERAKGGVGLIIVEAANIFPEGAIADRQLGVWDDKFIPGLTQLCSAIHSHGSKASIQISHGGNLSVGWEWLGGQPVAPSAIQPPPGYPVAKELAKEEISALIEQFASAAMRARAAGFDAIEFHGAHGFLINQFISSGRNFRKDEYGGTLEKRMRFPLEIIKQTKASIGNDYPLIFRISAHEHTQGGHTLSESRIVSQILSDAGVHAIHVSAGDVAMSPEWAIQPPSMAQGVLLPLAEAIKNAIKVPIITVGRISDPEFANRIIAKGQADFVALGRALLRNADWCTQANLALDRKQTAKGPNPGDGPDRKSC